MKKTLIIAMGLFVSLSAMGQVRVNDVTVVRDGGTAEVSFDAGIDKKATDRSNKLIMTPVIYKERHSVALAPIVIETRRTRIMDERKGLEPLPGAFMTGNDRTFSYTATIDYKNWLQGANLRFEIQRVGCCSETFLEPISIARNLEVTDSGLSDIRLGDMILIMDRNASLPNSFSCSAAQKPAQSVSGSSDIVFAQSSQKLNLTLENNNQTLGALVRNLGSERSLVGRIQITGYASPEGELAMNENLAKNRAVEVRNYLLDNVLWLRPSDFDVINGGENWQGLYQMVDTTRMPGRWQVMDIIERTPADVDDYLSEKSRKTLLQELNGGAVWAYMLNNLFPQLRNVTSIKYTLAPHETAADSETLSAEESAAQINRAIDLLGARDADGALAILNKVANDARAWNPMGVAYLLKNDATQAKIWFQKSADAGYAEAASNLKQTE